MSRVVANAPIFTANEVVTVNVTGFTYLKDYAVICGTAKDKPVKVIIGDKKSFGMQDMFMLKDSNGIKASYKGIKNVNGVDYDKFSLMEILF